MPKLTNSKGDPTSGQMPNCVVGIVTENVDPNEQGRIRVKFPTLAGEPTSFWIRQSSPMGGMERGFYALPEPDDEVLVVFLQGDIENGVIVGQFWNGTDLPPAEAKDGMPAPSQTEVGGGEFSTEVPTQGSQSLDANDRRFWKSRSGHLLVFDDSEGAESVQIWDAKHQMALVFDTNAGHIFLSNNKGDIHIRAENDLYLEARNDINWVAGKKINGQSGTDTVHLAKQNYSLEATMKVETKSGTDTNLEAGTNFSAKATVNFTAEGSVGMTVKGGATTTVQGGASTTIKGAMVMIN